MVNFRLYLKKRSLRRKRQQCFDTAFKICQIGFENGTLQKDLNNAKDLLYSIADKFELKIKNM